MLISPLNAFPWVINGLVQAWVSLKRLDRFLNLDNIDWLTYYRFNELVDPSVCLDVREAKFSWKSSDNEPESTQLYNRKIDLNDVNLKIKKGKFIGIIGKVGSGKLKHFIFKNKNLYHIYFFFINRKNNTVAFSFSRVRQVEWKVTYRF
jgi:ATP-binding cassette, subfamily C (CFTR/MRP), member 10